MPRVLAICMHMDGGIIHFIFISVSIFFSVDELLLNYSEFIRGIEFKGLDEGLRGTKQHPSIGTLPLISSASHFVRIFLILLYSIDE